jgi:hypothetical protein
MVEWVQARHEVTTRRDALNSHRAGLRSSGRVPVGFPPSQRPAWGNRSVAGLARRWRYTARDGGLGPRLFPVHPAQLSALAFSQDGDTDGPRARVQEGSERLRVGVPIDDADVAEVLRAEMVHP